MISRFAARGVDELDWRIMEEAAMDCIRVLARTKPVKRMRFYCREGREVIPCSWTNSWWARLIKWCLRKKLLHWSIPYPLEALANATEVTTANKTYEWSESVTDLIMAQIAEIKSNNRKPTLIAIGREKHFDLIHAFNFSPFPVLDQDGEMDGRFHGVPFIVTDKLEKDAVMVL